VTTSVVVRGAPLIGRLAVARPEAFVVALTVVALSASLKLTVWPAVGILPPTEVRSACTDTLVPVAPAPAPVYWSLAGLATV
jgi:hypothetical protein